MIATEGAHVRVFEAIAIGLIFALLGCASTSKPIQAGVLEPSGSEALVLPPNVELTPSGKQPEAEHWVLVTSLSAATVRATLAAQSGFDLSTQLPVDPWLGIFSFPPPLEQRIFVRSSEAALVKVDANSWTERLVIQAVEIAGPEPRSSARSFELSQFEDAARAMCHRGARRELISVNAAEMVIKSTFTDCPRFGVDRVMITRQVFGHWEPSTALANAYAFSYEVRGNVMTPAQYSHGLEIIKSIHVAAAGEQGSMISFAKGPRGGAINQ
jgi:hypothetical protein